MKIAYLTADFGVRVDGAKGASVHVRSMAAALGELGHEVVVLTPEKGPRAEGGGPRDEGEGVSVEDRGVRHVGGHDAFRVIEVPFDDALVSVYDALKEESGLSG